LLLLLLLFRSGGPAGYELGVLSAKGLGRADHFVVVLWVDNDVGHTAVLADSVAPVWTGDEAFHLKVPSGLRMEECVLEVQVRLTYCASYLSTSHNDYPLLNLLCVNMCFPDVEHAS